MVSPALAPMIDRSTRRLLGAYALSAIGAGLPWPLLLALTWEETHHDGPATAVVGAARLAPYIVLSWWTSRAADRFPRDRVIRVTLTLRALAALAVAAALTTHHTTAAVVACTVLVALGTPTYPAAAAALPAAAPDLTAATTCLVTIEVGGYVVGPALGALFLAEPARPLVAPLTVALATAAVLAFGRTRLRPGPAERYQPLEPLAPLAPLGAEVPSAGDGLVRFVTRTRSVAVALAVMAVINLADGVIGFTLLPLTSREWRASDAVFGIATAAFGFGALAAPLLGLVRVSAFRRIRYGLLGGAACIALVAPTPSVRWSVLPLVLGSGLSVLVEGATTEVLQQRVPDRMLASVFGLGDTLMSVGAIVGLLLAPTLVALLGARGTFVGLGLLVATTAALPATRHTLVGPATQVLLSPLPDAVTRPADADRVTEPFSG